MDARLFSRLKLWRDRQAAREGVEGYRVLSNAVLESIATEKPLTKEAFFGIKGFKDAKWRRYGAMLLPMVSDATSEETLNITDASPAEPEEHVVELFDVPSAEQSTVTKDDNTYSVGSFLDVLNDSFAGLRVRVRGEVSSVDERDRTTYFTIKDPADGSTLSCLVFQSAYRLSGVRLTIGQEIVVDGAPNIWKPTGRLSLKVEMIELVGEGALKKAYDELRRKLETEGIFAPERKQVLPEFPERIALITSNQGAAIGDFMTNVGQYGYKISLYNSSVEGKRAVVELLEAVRYFNRHPDRYDALVMIRGGGSLESLQAFNNETLVREVALSPIPVLAGIGHEKDVSLVALAADSMVSTPTAAARTLRTSWDTAAHQIAVYERLLPEAVARQLAEANRAVERAKLMLGMHLQGMFDVFVRAGHALSVSVERLDAAVRTIREQLSEMPRRIAIGFQAHLRQASDRCVGYDKMLLANDPLRILRLGYSLVTKHGKIVRSTADVEPGDTLGVRLSDGEVMTNVVSVRTK